MGYSLGKDWAPSSRQLSAGLIKDRALDPHGQYNDKNVIEMKTIYTGSTRTIAPATEPTFGPK